ncbi:MAG: hypothetical protein ACI3Z8_07635 [Paludibacteraceae bacterium]
MTAVEGATGTYQATVDDTKYNTLIFCRMNPEKSENNWDSKWNQTNDLTLSEAGDNNCYTIADGTWDKGGGTWSKYVYVADVYTVAGATAILGSEWNPADTNNDMTKQADGTYKLEKTDVLLNAGGYQYKIVVNHDWNPELMGNQTLTVEKAGYHTLTFTYNASTKAVNGIATLTKEAEVDPVIKVKGQFDNEEATAWKEETMTLAADKKTATTTLTLTARCIDLGILVDGNWYANGANITSTGTTASPLELNGSNMKLYTPIEGDYTFTYTLETKTLEVTFPDGTTLPLVRVFGSWNEWKTGTAFTPAADGLTASAKLTLAKGDYVFKVAKDVPWMTDEKSGKMTRTNSSDWAFVEGTKDTGLEADEDGEYTFTWTYEGDKLTVTFPAATATDLIGADSNNAAVKLIRDGQVLIVRDGVTYNMVGQIVR